MIYILQDTYIFALLIGIVNLLYIKGKYNAEYKYHRKSVLGFLIVIFTAYFFRLCNDLAWLFEGMYTNKSVEHIMLMVDYSGLRFTLIALAFTYMKNSKEPLSQFQQANYINLVSKT